MAGRKIIFRRPSSGISIMYYSLILIIYTPNLHACPFNSIQTASKTACLDYRIFTNGEDICFSMMDRIDHLNTSTFYNLQNDENPEAHLGIKILLKQADDVRYFTAYGSNNLIVHMKRKD